MYFETKEGDLTRPLGLVILERIENLRTFGCDFVAIKSATLLNLWDFLNPSYLFILCRGTSRTSSFHAHSRITLKAFGYVGTILLAMSYKHQLARYGLQTKLKGSPVYR